MVLLGWMMVKLALCESLEIVAAAVSDRIERVKGCWSKASRSRGGMHSFLRIV